MFKNHRACKAIRAALFTATGDDTLQAQSCALCFVHVPWRGIKAELAL